MKKYVFACLFVLAGAANANTISGFTGEYDPSNWTQSLSGGSIDTSGAPDSIVEISSNAGGGASSTDFTIAAPAAGTVSFDWDYVTADVDGSSYDPFGWLLNGVFTQVTTNGVYGAQSGSVSFLVAVGDVFGFRAYSTDSIFGSATTTISNFTAPSPVPLPAGVWLFGSGLVGLLGLRKKVKKAGALAA